MRRGFRNGIIATSIGVSAYIALDGDRRAQTIRNAEACYRIINLVSTVGGIAAEYGYHLRIKHPQHKNKLDSQLLYEEIQRLQHEQEQYTFQSWNTNDKQVKKELFDKLEENRLKIDSIAEKLALFSTRVDSDLRALHTKSAKKLVAMCKQNKGVYIKVGQHLAMMDHIIPEEYLEELGSLLSSNPYSDIESIRRVFKKEFDKFPEELFDSFDPKPIASASLAQVHIAYKGCRKYAVKVQHEGLQEGSTADRQAITTVVDILSKIFSGFNYTWLTREMNANLPQELDFNVEKMNIMKCKKYLKKLIDQGDVAVPDVIESISGQRVLTMTFEEGVYISNTKAIQEMNIRPSDVARITSTTFYEQIFRHGFVHCDPHEANLLVRKHPHRRGKPQLVLLDHGLYKEFGDEFRMNYCRLWRAIVCSNQSDIKTYATNLHVGELFTLLAAVLTMRSWDDITSDDMSRLKGNQSAAEREKLKFYAHRYFKEINSLLQNVPPEMLLLMKTNDCLRHIDRKLGAPINTATVIATIAADVILNEELSSSTSYLSAIRDYLRVQLRLIGFRVAEYIVSIRSQLEYN